MAGLPRLPYRDRIKKNISVAFGGYNHTASAKDGQIYDMKNMTGDLAPVLSPRKKRYAATNLLKPNGIHGNDGLYVVDGDGFYKDGVRKGTVADSDKTFADLGAYIIIFPDKKYYNKIDGSFGSLESKWQGMATIKDGTYAGESARGNTIYASGVNWASLFKVGDGVEIKGATKHPRNNKTAVIREIDGNNLRFYENVFEVGSGGDSETLTVSRNVPDMDFICENENRLWGCKGDTIYASKLGDPFNFNVFDGVATDSYAVNVGSSGDFTACAKFLGYACFFKEENIYKVYGDKPSNFRVMGSGSLGVKEGSSKSIAIASERMFYLSRAGVMVYSGGIPQGISQALGEVSYKNGAAGSDGRKYYISLETNEGTSLFVYDPLKNLWHKEDDLRALGFAYYKGLHILGVRGERFFVGDDGDKPANYTEEEAINSMVEFADFVENNPNKKGTSKLQIRVELEEDARVTVSMQFDSSGAWEEVQTLKAATKRSYYLPIIPRRSDHFKIKIEGVGNWKLHSLVRESYAGSEL